MKIIDTKYCGRKRLQIQSAVNKDWAAVYFYLISRGLTAVHSFPLMEDQRTSNHFNTIIY